MKKMFFLAMLAACQTVAADDYKYLTVGYNSVEQSITLESIQKITFENSQMVVATSNGNVTFAQSQLEKMYFSATATAIKEVETETSNSQQAELYDLSGRKVSQNRLQKGIYIINGKKVVK